VSVSPRTLRRVLIADEDPSLRLAMAVHVRQWGAQPLEAATVHEARALLAAAPDLMIVELRLRGESAFSTIEAAASLWPKPLCVVTGGVTSTDEAFRLAQLGVRALIGKPFTLSQLDQAVGRACAELPALDAAFAACVGLVPLQELQERLRHVMLRQALALSGGSRSAAARLLAVSRQAIQQMLRGRVAPRRCANPSDWTHNWAPARDLARVAAPCRIPADASASTPERTRSSGRSAQQACLRGVHDTSAAALASAQAGWADGDIGRGE
jgi:DNA-binding NtrC family response regulator